MEKYRESVLVFVDALANSASQVHSSQNTVFFFSQKQSRIMYTCVTWDGWLEIMHLRMRKPSTQANEIQACNEQDSNP